MLHVAYCKFAIGFFFRCGSWNRNTMSYRYTIKLSPWKLYVFRRNVDRSEHVCMPRTNRHCLRGSLAEKFRAPRDVTRGIMWNWCVFKVTETHHFLPSRERIEKVRALAKEKNRWENKKKDEEKGTKIVEDMVNAYDEKLWIYALIKKMLH